MRILFCVQLPMKIVSVAVITVKCSGSNVFGFMNYILL
jgi:hypothetical protein